MILIELLFDSSLCVYKKLQVFRTVCIESGPCVWWKIAQNRPSLKKQCCIMLRLLMGSSRLEADANHSVPMNERVCPICNLNIIEDLFHLIMGCSAYQPIRENMLHDIAKVLCYSSRQKWNSASHHIQMLICMGMEFPVTSEEIWSIRFLSCVYINRMYAKRKNHDPP